MGCNYSQHEIDSCYVLSPIPDCKWIIAHCRGNTWKEFEGKKKKGGGGEGGWRINCLSISQRIRDRHLVVKVDDKLKLGVGENVAPNTKRMILGCTEFECSRVSKATAGSVYLRGRASELLIEGHRFDSYWEHSKFFFSEYQACVIHLILNIILHLRFLYQKCIFIRES